MPKKENLLGQKFNRLLVIEAAPSKNKKTYWKCLCDCGNECIVRASSLKDGTTKSCGCLSRETRSKLGKSHIQDITGQKFGYLTALKRLKTRQSSSLGYDWECECECGNIITVPITYLKSGNTQSCGCAKESLGERNIGLFLLKNNIKFETQKKFDSLISESKNKLVFDFYLPEENIIIEFDGPQHYKNLENNRYSSKQGLKNDQIKNKWCLDNKISLFRIPYEIRNEIPKMKTLQELCKKEFQVLQIDFYNVGLLI